MAYSNRVSLDTDVIFLRTIFAFSTNNVPVSTNFIMAAGCNGQIIASDALRTLETYGIGYLPSTFSTFDGEIISVSLSVLSTGVTNSMLYSTQAFLLSNICSVQSNVNVLSSYVLENIIPSSFSTVNQQITELNSSFQGYVVSQAVTPAQLFSTTTGLVYYTDTSTSNLSTSVSARFATYSNYVAATYTPLSTFSNFSTGVSTSFSVVNASISTTNSNFVALSNFTRVGFQTISTTVVGLSNQVVGISNLVNTLSSITTDPYYTIGLMSTMPNVRFGSNIQASSITSTIFVRDSNVGIGTGAPATRLDISGALTVRGQIFGQNGSASAPSFSGLTDVDSGILFPGDGQVAIATNSEERYRFTPGVMYSFSNRYEGVGYNSNKSIILDPIASYSGNPNITIKTTIGDTSGGAPLIEMQTPTLSMRQFLVPQVDSVPSFGLTNRHITYMYTPSAGASEAIIMDPSGQVGIRGNTDPGYALNVNGSIKISKNLVVDTNTLYVDAGANSVGVLCNTPGYSLDVNGDINFSGTLRQNGSPYGGGGGTTNVLGTISSANQVYFGSNITASTMNLNGNLDVSGQIYLLKGSAGAPALVNSQDISDDTGIFFPADGQLSITTNGQERYRFTAGAMYSFSNRYEGVGYNSNKTAILEAGSGPGDYPNLTLTTTVGDTSGGVPTIAMETPSLKVVQYLVPATGTGYAQYDALNTYVYPQPANTPNFAYGIDPSGQMGIQADTTPNTSLTVGGNTIIGGNLTVDTNTLYVDAGANRVGVLCNTPGYSLDVNGDINFSGTLRQNGNPYSGGGGGGTANVLGTISSANQVYFGSNITVSTMNLGSGTLFASNTRVGINCNTPGYSLDVSGTTNLNGRIFSQQGSVGAPAFSSSNDPQSGLFFPNNQVSITTTGEDRYRFTSGALFSFCNRLEAVGYNSNKNIVLDQGAFVNSDTSILMKTNVTDSANGELYITLENGSLRMRQYLAPATGTGVAQMNAFNAYMYPLPGTTANLAYVIDASGQMGIQGNTNAGTALTVNGITNITSNLIVDTNTLYVDAGTNRVGVLCNTPNYSLDVNGSLYVASNLSTVALTVSSVFSYVSTPRQNTTGLVQYMGDSGSLNNSASNITFFSNDTSIFSKYNAINLSFNVYSQTNQTVSIGGEWMTLRVDTNSITSNSNAYFTIIPAPCNAWSGDTFNYTMVLNRDFTRTDTYVKLLVNYVNTLGAERVLLTYFSMTGIY